MPTSQLAAPKLLLLIMMMTDAQVTEANDTEKWPFPQDIPVTTDITVDLAGSRPADIMRYLLARGALAAELSPDGQTVAFTDRVTGEPQLWIVNATGGWPRQISFGEGVRDFRWSPAGDALLVTHDSHGDEREGYYLLSRDGTRERELLPPSGAFRRQATFSSDGHRLLYASTERNGRDFDLYLLNLRSGEPEMVYEGSFGFFARAWQPEGDRVLVDETRGEDANNVHLLDIATREIKPLFQPEEAAYYGAYQWHPAGTGFYLATNQDRDRAGLAYYDLRTDSLDYVETPDQGVVEDVALSHDANYLAWVVNTEGVSTLFVRHLATGELVKTPTLPRGVLRVQFAASSNHLQLYIKAPRIPGDVLVWDLDARNITRAVASTLAGLNPASLVEPASLNFQAQDGETLQGFLYLPQTGATGKPAPVVVRVHGGPSAQARPVYRPQVQYLVNRGIAVFDVNVRGSTGFGKRFSRLDNREKRLDSVRDLSDTVDFLQTVTGVDANRAAVMGGSYGGYMVNAVLGSYPNVFKAGASFVGVSNWVRALEQASPSLKASDRVEYGDITEDRWRRFYLDNSPINNAHRIKVPLLVQHGANDPRDPVTESDSIVRSVRDGGGEVTYLRFPDEGHSISKQMNRIIFNRALSSFFERHLLASES